MSRSTLDEDSNHNRANDQRAHVSQPVAQDSHDRDDPLPQNEPDPIVHVALVGAGWSGKQIAAQVLAHGKHVYLNDVSQIIVEQASVEIQNLMRERVAEGTWPAACLESVSNRLHSIVDFSQTDVQLDLIVECVSEQVSIKRRILRDWSERFPAPTIIASNSSYFVPSLLAKYVDDATRYAHLHFHVPVWHSTITDISTCSATSEGVIQRLVRFSKEIGQTPIVQRVENPGYIFNWMLQALLRSALELIDRKVATPEEIELVWTKVTGMPLGPIKIMDQIGLDVIHQVMVNARWGNPVTASDPDALIRLLETLVDADRLGMKSGKGFFEYKD